MLVFSSSVSGCRRWTNFVFSASSWLEVLAVAASRQVYLAELLLHSLTTLSNKQHCCGLAE